MRAPAVRDLQRFARGLGLVQVVVAAMDEEGTITVASYGERGETDKRQAAAGADLMRKTLGFPEGPLDEDYRARGLEPELDP